MRGGEESVEAGELFKDFRKLVRERAGRREGRF